MLPLILGQSMLRSDLKDGDLKDGDRGDGDLKDGDRGDGDRGDGLGSEPSWPLILGRASSARCTP
jgi:hypothetical protein